MNIFIFEGNPQRILGFKEALKKHNLTIAGTVQEAFKKFPGPYDMFLLNHGGTLGIPTGEGLEFSKIMTTAPGRATVVIHAWNVPTARRMEQELLLKWQGPVYRIEYGRDLLDWLERLDKVHYLTHPHVP